MKESAYNKIIAKLESDNIKYDIYDHSAIKNVSMAHLLANYDTSMGFKTLAFTVNNQIYFFVLHGNDRLKYSKIVKLLGINRNDLKMCDPKVLVEKYGYEIGSLSPIKVYGDITIIIDKRIYEFEYIVCGVGISTKTLKINVLDLLKEPSNIIADII